SPRPPVLAAGERLGSLDMREWVGTIRAVDEQFALVVDEGLFEITGERRFVVPDVFDSGDDFVDVVSEWNGTRIAPGLAAKIRKAAPPVSVAAAIRLRLLARKP